MLKRFAERALDLLFPRICPLCGEAPGREGRFFCRECLSSLRPASIEGEMCGICGLSNPGSGFFGGICPSCRDSPPAFDRARSAVLYGGGIAKVLKGFKYSGALWYLEDLCDLMEIALRSHYDCGKIDVLVPVPLHPSKKIARTYNQSELLAKGLGRRFSLPVAAGALAKKESTPPQASLPRKERLSGMRGKIAAADKSLVASRTVLAIDDVMTTGATFSETARALKEAGAKEVWCLSAGRAPYAMG